MACRRREARSTTYTFDFDFILMICGDGMTKLPGISYNETD